MKKMRFSRRKHGNGNVEDDFVKAARETPRWGGPEEDPASTRHPLHRSGPCVTRRAPWVPHRLRGWAQTPLDLPWSQSVCFFIFRSSSEPETWDSATHPSLHNSVAISSSLAQTVIAQLACLLTSSFFERRSSTRGSKPPEFLSWEEKPTFYASGEYQP